MTVTGKVRKVEMRKTAIKELGLEKMEDQNYIDIIPNHYLPGT